MFIKRSLSNVLVLGACVAAHAGTMTFTGMDTLSGTANIGGSHYNGGVGAGFMDFNETTLGSIKSVCVDLDHIISNGQSWPDKIFDSATYDDAGIRMAGNIVAKDFASANTKDKAEGLQLAVWEARYDGSGTNSTPDFAHGNFTASDLSAGVLAAANTYFADRNIAGNATYIRSEDGKGQDQMTCKAVPEPASIAALGMGVISLVRRRAVKKG